MTTVIAFQRALPDYRVDVFNSLARECELTVIYGDKKSIDNTSRDIRFSTRQAFYKQSKLGFSWYWSHLFTSLNAEAILLPLEPRCISLPIIVVRAVFLKRRIVFWTQGYSKTNSGRFSRTLYFLYSIVVNRVIIYSRRGERELSTIFKETFIASNTIHYSPDLLSMVQSCKLERVRKKRSQELNVLIVSRLQDRNRLELLFEALKIVSETALVNLVIIGSDLTTDKVTNKFREIDRVKTALRGPVYEAEEIARAYINADVAVLPSCVGLSIIQAFAFSTPFITSRDGGSHGPEFEALIHGYNGQLYVDSSSHSLAIELLKFLDKSFIVDCSLNASLTYKSKYSIDGMIQVMKESLSI